MRELNRRSTLVYHEATHCRPPEAPPMSLNFGPQGSQGLDKFGMYRPCIPLRVQGILKPRDSRMFACALMINCLNFVRDTIQERLNNTVNLVQNSLFLLFLHELLGPLCWVTASFIVHQSRHPESKFFISS